jgi:hypothetical protein
MSQDDARNHSRAKIFLLCSRRPIVAEFILLAEAIGSEEDFETVLVVPDGLAELLPETLPSRCSVIYWGRRSWKMSRWGSLAYSAFGALRLVSGLVRKASFSNVGDFIDTWEAIARGRWMAHRVLHIGQGGVAVLTADDRDIRFDQGVLRAARDLGIFTMAVSFGKSDPDADALRRDIAVHDIDMKPLKRVKAAIVSSYPQGLRIAPNGRRLLFFKPGEFFALRAHDALFPLPWTYGGGRADTVTVLDGAGARLLSGMGVPAEKILVTGQCSHDVLWSSMEQRSRIRKFLDKRYRLDPKRPLVILAMPVLGEHGMSSAEDQQREAKFLLQTLGEMQANVLVSLHPRQDANCYEAMIRDCALALAVEPLRDVLAAADLFVAYSTTINWAQLLSVPSVALEYYSLGYTLFQGQPGVVVVSRRVDLAPVCASVLNSADVREKLVEQMKALESRKTFDGEVRKRLVGIIRQRYGGTA